MASGTASLIKPPAALLDDAVYERYSHLPTRIGGKADAPLSVCLEYIWLSRAAVCGNPTNILSKTKVVAKEPKSIAECSAWIFDGVATQQAPGMDSECVLVPVLLAEDPFRLSPHKLVFCELRKHDGTPIPSNTRDDFVRALRSKPSARPWWGIEQEVVIMDSSLQRPLGWPPYGGKPPRSSVYCRTGVDVIGRKMMEALLRCCLYSGINCSGINLECMPACIEWQVGPLEGVECADHLWLSRYVLGRLAEEFGVGLSYAPKVLPEAPGSGLHTNFSTEKMRAENGFSEILRAVDRLSKKHIDHIAVYGPDNELRLTGADDAPAIETFTFGVATRAVSVRVPRECERRMRGWLEDRRPAANADPYAVCAKIFRTCVIEDPGIPFEHHVSGGTKRAVSGSGSALSGTQTPFSTASSNNGGGASTPATVLQSLLAKQQGQQHPSSSSSSSSSSSGQPSQPQPAPSSIAFDVQQVEKGPAGETSAHPVAGISGTGVAKGGVMVNSDHYRYQHGGDVVSAEDAPVGPGVDKNVTGQHPTAARPVGREAEQRAPESTRETTVFQSEAERGSRQ